MVSVVHPKEDNEFQYCAAILAFSGSPPHAAAAESMITNPMSNSATISLILSSSFATDTNCFL